jgi:hypothetical protein
MYPRELYLDSGLDIIARESDKPEDRAEFARLADEHRAQKKAEHGEADEQEKKALEESCKGNQFLQKEGIWPSEDLKPGEKRLLPDVLEMVSQRAGISVYAEHYMDWALPAPRSAAKEPLWQYLQKLQNRYAIEWRASDDVVYVTYRYWYEKLECEVPERLLEEWRKRFQEKGRLDLFDLIEVSSALTQAQARNLSRDHILRGAATAVSPSGNYHSLRFLASLNLRPIDVGGGFLRFTSLTRSQAEGFTELAQTLTGTEPAEVDPQSAGLTVALAPLGQNDWGADPRSELVTITFVWSEGKEHKCLLYLRPPKEKSAPGDGKEHS